MFVASPSGFTHAPLTKAWIGALAVSFWLSSTFLPSPSSVSVPASLQALRLFISPMTITSVRELTFGVLLIYNMRLIERYFGSSKYAAFLSLSYCLSTVVNLCALAFPFDLKSLQLFGPYLVFGALLYQYHKIIPTFYDNIILGISRNDKTLVYLVAYCTFCTSESRSFIAGACGVTIGALFHHNVARIKEWRYPLVFQDVAAKYLCPILSTSTSKDDSTNASDEVEAYVNSTAPRRARDPPVNEESVTSLTAMFPGIAREEIVGALSITDGSVSGAVELLLAGH